MDSHREFAPDERCVAVIVPVFNESETVGGIVRLILLQSCVREVVIIDDASTDGSWEVIQEVGASDPRIQSIRHERNSGKGAAVRAGIQRATAPLILIQDADLEYDPAEYARLIGPILTAKADVVFASRFGGSGEHRVLYFWHYLGNRLLTLFSNMLTNLNLSDMEACYKVFRREIFNDITIEEDRFGFEPEIVAKVAALGLRIYEVPISYHGRTYAEGKKVSWRDGFSALRAIFRYGLFRRLMR